MSEAVLDRSSCTNCGTELTGAFCAECGQKAASGPPTVREFAHDAAEELFDVDGKIFKTLRLLFFKPGFLTREQFAGRQVRYVRPLRLYLICSITAFSVMALTSGGATMADADEPFLTLLPQFMFVMMPAFALIVMLVMRGSGRTYPQHLYFALHVHAVMFVLTAATVPFDVADSRTVRGLAVLTRVALTVLYGLMALRTAYDLRWVTAMTRGTVIMVAYLAWMFAFVFLVTAAYVGWGTS